MSEPASPAAFETLSHTRAGAKRVYVPQKKNEDRVLVREFSPAETGLPSPSVLITVADGVSRCADGGAVAQWILHDRIENDIIFNPAEGALLKQFHTYLGKIHREFLEQFRSDMEMLESGCTFSAVLVVGDDAAAYWAGDSPIYHFKQDGDHFKSRTVSIADKDPFSGALTDCFSGVTPFSVKQAGIRANPGDILIAVSDGVAYDGEDLARMVAQRGFTEEWLDTVCQLSFEVPLSDDITLTAVKLPV